MISKKTFNTILIFLSFTGVFSGLWIFRNKWVEKTPTTSITHQTNEPIIKEGEDINVECTSSSYIEYLSYPSHSSFDKPNNKFGIYIYAEEDRFFKYAKELVNSSGGDWGYVLIPYNVKDKDVTKWKKVFNHLSDKHLIPIIQLWDIDPNDYKNDTKKSAEFLNGFLWPVKERYISVYNEPNDDKFWRGNADPKNYATVLNYTIDTYKKENPNFFMLNGALNASAPDTSGYINPLRFMKEMNDHIPGVFNKLDGWASHPYPQPNFSGSPTAAGLWSIRAYETELKYLRENLGLKKDLPVFITETGWAHAQGENYQESYVTAEKAADYFKMAYEEVWLKDDAVRAVTPFTIFYNPPFDHFSWIGENNVPYEQFNVVKEMKKEKGEPASLINTVMKITECD